MWKMHQRLALLAAGLAGMLALQRAHAAVTASVTGNSTTGSFSAWPTLPNAGDSTAGNTNLSQFNSAENNYGSGPPTGGSLSQSFLCTQSGTLSDLEFVISGTAPVTFNAALYDAGTTTGLSDTSVNAYGNGADVANGTPGSGGVVVPVSSNLLPASSTGLIWNGFTQTGANAAVLDVHVDPSDNVNLVSGHEYVFEVNSPSSAANFLWLRMANNAVDYANGQAFRSRAPLNGNPARDMSFGAIVAPEPASVALIGIAFTALAARRRA